MALRDIRQYCTSAARSPRRDSLRSKSIQATSRAISPAGGSTPVVSRTARRSWSASLPGSSLRSRSANRCRLLVGELAVQEPEGLGGHRGRVPDGAARVGVRSIVDGQDRHLERPLHADEDAAPGRFLGPRCLPARPGTDCPASTSRGMGGQMLGPPAFAFRLPLTARMASRISSADSRASRTARTSGCRDPSPARPAWPSTTSGRCSRARSSGASA